MKYINLTGENLLNKKELIPAEKITVEVRNGKPYFFIGEEEFQGQFPWKDIKEEEVGFIVSFTALYAIYNHKGLEQYLPKDFVCVKPTTEEIKDHRVAYHEF